MGQSPGHRLPWSRYCQSPHYFPSNCGGASSCDVAVCSLICNFKFNLTLIPFDIILSEEITWEDLFYWVQEITLEEREGSLSAFTVCRNGCTHTDWKGRTVSDKMSDTHIWVISPSHSKNMLVLVKIAILRSLSFFIPE